MKNILVISVFFLALGLWVVFGFLLFTLGNERAEFAAAQAQAREDSVRGESASRLRVTIQDTQSERAALETAATTPILDAIEIVESAGARSGASNVSIGNATPVGGTFPDGIMAVAVVVNADGTFTSLMRTLSVLETLPIPSVLEQFELEHVKEGWRLNARLRLIVAASNI